MTAFADMPAVLTVEEAGQLLRIGRSAAYEAARRGEIPVIRVGRLLRVPRHALEALLGMPPENESSPAAATPGSTKSTDDGGQHGSYPTSR